MSRTFWLVSSQGKKRATVTPADRAAFRADAIEIETYYAGPGEAIVISRGQNTILLDGGSGTDTNSNDVIGRPFAARLRKNSLVAIVASHPHRDHTNFHHYLATALTDRFAVGSLYFDNDTPGAVSNWNRLVDWQANLPFESVPIIDNPTKDAVDKIPLFSGEAECFLLRGTTGATTVKGQKYWSVFMFLRFREAWMLFTGDAYKGYEKNKMLQRLKSLNPHAHLIKVTHHGSSDGTAPELVSSLKPGISIVSTAADAHHRLECDVRKRLSRTAIYTTFDRSRPAHPKKDVVVRTDGRTWTQDGFDGVLFEVWQRDAALGALV